MKSPSLRKEWGIRLSRILLVVTASLCGPIVADTIYKCVDENGSIIFSQSPCGETPERIEIQEYKMPGTKSETTEQGVGKPVLTPDDYNKELKERLAARKWKRKEQSLLSRIKALELERDSKIKTINEELEESWDHQKNRTRRMRVQAVKEEYRWRIDGAQRELRNHWATKN